MPPRLRGRWSARVSAQPLIASIGIGALIGVLAVRDPMPLPSLGPLPDVTVTMQAGVSGAERDGSGPFWWVVEPEAELRVYNNRTTDVVVDLRFTLAAPPCDSTRTVEVVHDGVRRRSTTDLGPVEVSVPALRLGSFDAQIIRIVGDDEPCAPGGGDERRMYVMVRDPLVVARS